MNSWGPNRDSELAMHPTVKPVAMIGDAMKYCSRKGGIVLDPFCGSGTTIMAAEATGRLGRGIELDPIYVDVSVERWQAATGKKAALAGTGELYQTLKAGGRENG